MAHEHTQVVGDDWVTFPGGELEGRRPKVLCKACRDALARDAAAGVTSRPARSGRPLCFQCYRAELDRERALRAAGQLNTASEERFQTQLPFEPVDLPRLQVLKADRREARVANRVGVARFVDKRRQAQIAARHALQRIAAGLQVRALAPSDRERVLAQAAHAAELQLPDAWVPFVVSR